MTDQKLSGTVGRSIVQPGLNMLTRLALVFFFLYSAIAGAQQAIVTLEEPVDGGIASGVTNIRGWAVSDAGVDRIELFVDGQFYSEIPYGGQRGDVESAFPSIPNSINSGFGQTYNYSEIGTGEHTFTVRAYMKDGELVEDSADFTVAALPEPFYPDAIRPNFERATALMYQFPGNEKIYINNVVVDSGERVDLELSWSTPTQGFAITNVVSKPPLVECSAYLTDELDTEAFTFTSDDSNASEIDSVIQMGSFFELNLTNGSSEDVSLKSLTFVLRNSDGAREIYQALGSDVTDDGLILAGETLYTPFTIVFSGAIGTLEAEYLLAYEDKCFTLSFDFYNSQGPNS